MREEVDQAEVVLARIALRQHGIVSVAQLYSVGIEKSGISRRVRSGRLHRLHRGVYAVGHRPVSREGTWMAAVLALGEGAVLSHGSAAALWGLLAARDGPVDVSVPTRGGRRERPGIRLHRYLSLVAGTTTRRLGIPVTTPAKTIDDLRGIVPPRQWRRAVRQAELAGLRLGPEVETDGTRSDLERGFLRLCRRGGLPAPEVNVRIGRWTVDFLWRRERLVVEADSYRYHRGRIAFQDDHARDLDLRRRGYEVRRFDERQIGEERERIVTDLAEALAVSRTPAPGAGRRDRGRG